MNMTFQSINQSVCYVKPQSEPLRTDFLCRTLKRTEYTAECLLIHAYPRINNLHGQLTGGIFGQKTDLPKTCKLDGIGQQVAKYLLNLVRIPFYRNVRMFMPVLKKQAVPIGFLPVTFRNSSK